MRDVDPGGVGVMQRNQLRRFVIGIGDQPVGLVDHLLLAHRAQRRLRCVAVGQGRVLDRGQGVRGVHQRHRPAVAGQPPDLTGEPVVRVHDVVVPGLVGGFGPQHAGRERAQLRRQVVFVQPLERAGHHVAHQHPGRHPRDGRIGGRRGPGEDLHLDTAAGQMQRALQHVDVHPAGIAHAGLRKRRRVHCQHRDATRIGQLSSVRPGELSEGHPAILAAPGGVPGQAGVSTSTS